MSIATKVAGWLAAPQVQATKEVLGRVPLWLWVGGILGLLLAVQTWRLSSAQHKIELHAAEVRQWEEANTANVRAIRLLTEANEAFAKAADKRSKRAKEAEDELADWLAKHAQRPTQARKEREKIYDRNPEARAWAGTRVPDAVSASLRK